MWLPIVVVLAAAQPAPGATVSQVVVTARKPPPADARSFGSLNSTTLSLPRMSEPWLTVPSAATLIAVELLGSN